ncbi:hypothetical protein BABINDRAFT_161679 [Babjeviella inositovora NRRL Y-12698]|uniref:Uncharacterized protein n=1 Tax=Babjeviella inositovora NRRL Y-12698 TaxID=984486 RepID=A0A1E3QQS4_9ASCO|nr:uncharacterized protein BABINDRAFT_161679 [Babjeviella inositovora NRRL Y-12698]ODQ80039.1 hypothetical protein BABINDRAFT_161679 [Babjeviella inositovora NRRL Y-12698]
MKFKHLDRETQKSTLEQYEYIFNTIRSNLKRQIAEQSVSFPRHNNFGPILDEAVLIYRVNTYLEGFNKISLYNGDINQVTKLCELYILLGTTCKMAGWCITLISCLDDDFKKEINHFIDRGYGSIQYEIGRGGMAMEDVELDPDMSVYDTAPNSPTKKILPGVEATQPLIRNRILLDQREDKEVEELNRKISQLERRLDMVEDFYSRKISDITAQHEAAMQNYRERAVHQESETRTLQPGLAIYSKEILSNKTVSSRNEANESSRHSMMLKESEHPTTRYGLRFSCLNSDGLKVSCLNSDGLKVELVRAGHGDFYQILDEVETMRWELDLMNYYVYSLCFEGGR